MRSVDNSVFLAEGSRVIGDVTIGKDSGVWYNAVIRGMPSPITIWERTNIQDGAVLHAKTGSYMKIGNDVTIGHSAVVHCREVGDNTLIGMGAIILEDTMIGKNCLIGAGALVTQHKVIPDGSLVYGAPAKIIRPLTEEETAGNTENAAEYVKLARRAKESR